MTPIAIGQIAGLIALVQVVPYLLSILHGKTKPERMSYLIWSIVNVVSIVSYIGVGARTTIWTGIFFTLTGFIILMLSIKHGLGGVSKFDIVCLCLALIGLSLWVKNRDPLMTLYFITFVGFIGYLPTLRKAYFLPKTENTLSWSLAAAASTLNLFALTDLQPKFVIPVVCTATLQGIVASLLIFPSIRFRASRKKVHKIHAFLAHPIFAK